MSFNKSRYFLVWALLFWPVLGFAATFDSVILMPWLVRGVRHAFNVAQHFRDDSVLVGNRRFSPGQYKPIVYQADNGVRRGSRIFLNDRVRLNAQPVPNLCFGGLVKSGYNPVIPVFGPGPAVVSYVAKDGTAVITDSKGREFVVFQYTF